MSECKTCSGSGETGQYGILDCTDCNAAMERAALNAAVTSAELMSGYDERWFAYQLGKKAALEEAAQVCEAESVDNTGTEGDIAYNNAISHCATAIRALSTTN